MTKYEQGVKALEATIPYIAADPGEDAEIVAGGLYLALEMIKEKQWVSVKDRLPENQQDVLVVKQLKSGQRNIGIGYCITDYEYKNFQTGETWRAPYWVCSGNSNVIYWMPLPEIPKGEAAND